MVMITLTNFYRAGNMSRQTISQQFGQRCSQIIKTILKACNPSQREDVKRTDKSALF